jgi:hypothetical protein
MAGGWRTEGPTVAFVARVLSLPMQLRVAYLLSMIGKALTTNFKACSRFNTPQCH